MKIPSTTEVIRWADQGSWGQVPEEILAMAQDRGKEVHRFAHAYSIGAWMPEDVPEGVRGYLESFMNWHKEHVARTIFCEQFLIHPVYAYSGTPDWYGVLKDGAEALVDFKTSALPIKSWRLQIAAYHELLVGNDHKVDRVGTLQPKKDGGMAIFRDWPNTLARDTQAFLSVLSAWRWFNDD